MASRSWNRIELIGNLTRDVELRFVPSGVAVATFGIATNRTYMSEGERKEEVDFHKVVSWNKLAELCNQLLKKGSRVFISGRLQYREWEGQDKIKRRDAEIVLEDMVLLTPKSDSGGGEYQSTPQDLPEPTPKAAKTEPKAKEEAAPSEDATVEEPPKEDSKPQAQETVADEDLPF